MTANRDKDPLYPHVAFVGLGSNSSRKETVLLQALKNIEMLEGVYLESVSNTYDTEPQDYINQPWFANQVVKLMLAESWEAEKLLDTLLKLEISLGRKRDVALRFGPREIDLDLLLFDNLELESLNCVLPHPRLCQRAFVLLPLLEIAPELEVNGQPLTYWLNNLHWRMEGNKIFQIQKEE